MPQMQRKKGKRRSKKFKLLILMLALVAIGILVYFNLRKEKPAETFATIPVKRGPLVQKLAETGTIELVRTVEVKSTVSGEIRELLAKAGDRVKSGQVMAVIEPDPAQSMQLYQKRSAVEQARINLQDQENAFGRKKALFEREMLSLEEFEEAEMALTRTRNALRLAALELDILEAKANLDQMEHPADPAQRDEVRVLAPISGIVIRQGVEVGEVVASGISSFSGGTALFEIGDPSRMIVRAEISEIDIGQLKVEQQVDIVVDAYPDTTYRGSVRWIAPVGQKKQGNPIVTFDTEIEILDHEPALRQGMSADLDIIFARRDSTLFLPVEAVLEVFEEGEEGEQKTKGRRGRFVAYAQRASVDTATTDSLSRERPGKEDEPRAEAVVSDSEALTDTTVDSSDVAKDQKPVKLPLDEFAEITVQVGLETSTRIEILSGRKEGGLVAADAELIKRKQAEKGKKESSEKTKDKE